MTGTITEDKTRRLETLLAEARRVAVVTHTRPDGDAIGSASAMAAWLSGKDVRVLLPNAFPDFLGFVVKECCEGRVLRFDREPCEALRWIGESDLIVCMDASGFDRVEGMQEALKASSARKILIDHHLGPDEDDFDLVFSEVEISSASELLFWILLALAGTGDATDTNNFANSVFPSTFGMASKMLEAGVDRDGILQELYNRCRENRLRMMGYLLKEKLRVLPNGAAYMVVRSDELARYDIRDGEMEGMVNMPLTLDAVRLSILLREDDGFFRVSRRSKRGTSAFRLAGRFFHGGGHEQASGGRLCFPADIADPSLAEEYLEHITDEFFNTPDRT